MRTNCGKDLCIWRKKSEWAVDHIMKQQRKRSGNKHAYKLTAAIEGLLTVLAIKNNAKQRLKTKKC